MINLRFHFIAKMASSRALPFWSYHEKKSVLMEIQYAVSMKKKLSEADIDYLNAFSGVFADWDQLQSLDTALFVTILMGCDEDAYSKITIPEAIKVQISDFRQKVQNGEGPTGYDVERIRAMVTYEGKPRFKADSLMLVAMQRRIDALEKTVGALVRRNEELAAEIAAMWGPDGPAERMGKARFEDKTANWDATNH
jgi:hypothetical protein